jgi:hypothetical protein
MNSLNSTKSDDALCGPYHLLLSTDNNDVWKESRKRFLERDIKLKTDFVAKRYRASMSKEEENILWPGVSNLERALVSCCEPIENRGIESGVLHHDKVLQFLSIVAVHCHALNARALVLAVLERTLKADLEDQCYRLKELRANTLKFESPVKAQTMNVKQDSEDLPANKKTAPIKQEPVSIKLEPVEPKQEVTLKASPEKQVITRASVELADQQESGRIRKFLVAGGISILTQWLIDASTPVIPKDTASIAVRPRTAIGPTLQESATGSLLIVLINFLAGAPFDKQLVTQSKINKHIRRLSKQVDQIINERKEIICSSQIKYLTSPVTGGLPLLDVRASLDALKSAWEERVKKNNNSISNSAIAIHDNITTPLVANDPMAAFKALLKDRVDVLKLHSVNDPPEESGVDSKPEWLVKVQTINRDKLEKKRPAKSPASSEELNRREREKESAAMYKDDLAKAQEARRQIREMLRNLAGKTELDERRNMAVSEPKSTRRVHWKDGLSSSTKNSELLDEVFAIPHRLAGVLDIEKEDSEDMDMDEEDLHDHDPSRL